MNTAEKKAVTSLYLRRGLRNRIKSEAALKGVSMGEVIERAFIQAYGGKITDAQRLDWLDSDYNRVASISLPRELSGKPIRDAIDELMGNKVDND